MILICSEVKITKYLSLSLSPRLINESTRSLQTEYPFPEGEETLSVPTGINPGLVWKSLGFNPLLGSGSKHKNGIDKKIRQSRQA